VDNTNKSRKRVSEYRRLMGVREGLSFSDYGNDDKTPYEVKPPEMLRPMQEDDYPIQARDLFGNGLNEGDSDTRGAYWIFPDGEMREVGSHWKWAVEFLVNCHVNSDDLRYLDDTYEHMYKRGFVRFLTVPHPNIKNTPTAFIDYSRKRPPTNQQWRVIKDFVIENNFKLYDDAYNKDIDLTESLKMKSKRDRRIFILEHMMPQDTDTFKSHLAQLFEYLQKELQLKTIPQVKLLSDQKNADKVLGKTAYYDPEKRTICLYETNRHQKDILRSFAHEVIHHWQHENERLKTSSTGGKKGESPQTQDPQYAQKDPWLRQMEKQAYLLGNILFRDWEDQKKAKDRKSQKTMVELTPAVKNTYHSSHSYRAHVEPYTGMIKK